MSIMAFRIPKEWIIDE